MIGVYCTDPITLRHFVSRDAKQTPTYTNLALMGRVERSTKLVLNPKGEQVVATGPVLLPGTVPSVTHQDRLIIDGVEYAIVAISQKRSFSRSHWELWIQ